MFCLTYDSIYVLHCKPVVKDDSQIIFRISLTEFQLPFSEIVNYNPIKNVKISVRDGENFGSLYSNLLS